MVAHRLVVGVDDSDGARAALRWAWDEAALRSAELQVVNVWMPPWAFGFDTRWDEDRAWFSDQSRTMIDKMVAEVAEERQPGVATTSVPLEAEGPAFGLLEAAKGADLLVVGARGRGGFAGLLMGSVASQCPRHAPCPVVVVPAGD